MGSRRRRFGAAFAALAALLLSIAGIITSAVPAFANAADPLPTTTGSATVAPNGDVTVTVSGTWKWLSQTCAGRFGTGWAVAWGDPNAPGNLVSKGGISILVGTPTDNTVHYDLAFPLGTCDTDGHPTGNWTDTHTYKAGTPIGDICVNMYDLHKSPADKPGDYVAGGPKHNTDNSVETNTFDPNSNTSGYCFKPAKIKLHKVNDHVPPQPLQGAVFGLWSGNAAVGNPVMTCTSQADGSCEFAVVNAPGDYTLKEISAPAGYSVDPDPRTVHVDKGTNLDVQPPFVDPRDTGWARIVKKLQDNNGNDVVVADKHVLDGAAFVLYLDKNNNGTYENGEAAKLWPEETADATCTIANGDGQCDIGPVVPGTYRVHETAAPPNTIAGHDVNVTVIKSTKANPVVVNYINKVGNLDIHLVKGGPTLAHVGDTFAYTFDATTPGPVLFNIKLEELAPNRCTGPISAATGDANNNGALDPGETWHWTCNHTVTAADPNPLPNTAKVTGTDAFGRSVSDTDEHSVIIIHPAIEVVKTGASLAHEGDKVTYSFKVTNTGDAALVSVAVDDNKLGNIGTIALLSAGDTVTLTKDFIVPAGTAVDNTVTACGTDPLSLKVCDDDHHHLVVIHPAIEVLKTGAATAHVGDSVTYSFKVTNTGDVALSNVVVRDDILGNIGTISSLAVGESKTVTKGFTVPDEAAVDNTATACGTDSLAREVCDDDHHHLVVIHPGIEVIKSGPATSHVGDTVTYSFAVTNTGDVALSNVAVTDDKLGAIGTIASLAVGETKTLTKDFVVPNVVSVENTATACGVDPLSLKLCDEDHHKLTPIHPAINVVKSGPAQAHVGDTITYKFDVTDVGDVSLHNVVLADPRCDIAPVIVAKTGTGDDILDLGDHWFYECDHKITATDPDPLPNTATVTGVDPLSKTVTDTDDHTVDIIHPAIEVVKSAATEAHEGDKVTYSFKVTNTGDIALTNVVVTDDKLGEIGTIPSLAVGESKTLTKDFVVPTPSTADIDNTATACGTDPLSTKVCDEDHHKLIPKHPKIDVLKRGPATANANATVTYTFVVTNTGDIDLTNVQVTDDKLGAIGVIPSLAVGQSVTLSKDFVVPAGSTAVDNIVTACGTDTLSVQVCDTDNHHLDVTQVLGEQFTQPPATLAVTGRNNVSGLLIGMLLVLGGIGLRRMRRRNRQPEA